MNIYQKMSQATQKIERVAKNLSVGTGMAKYKAVGEADVLEAVKPIEIELGIYSYPYSREIIETNVFTTTSEYNGQVKEKNNLFLRVQTVYRFVNVEQPDEYIDITTYGDGVDSQDKAPGKAMTYADKYALLKAYKIETGDDPDKDISESGTYAKKTPIPKKPEPKAPIQESKGISDAQIKRMFAMATHAGVKSDELKELIKKAFKVDDLHTLTREQYDRICAKYEVENK